MIEATKLERIVSKKIASPFKRGRRATTMASMPYVVSPSLRKTLKRIIATSKPGERNETNDRPKQRAATSNKPGREMVAPRVSKNTRVAKIETKAVPPRVTNKLSGRETDDILFCVPILVRVILWLTKRVA